MSEQKMDGWRAFAQSDSVEQSTRAQGERYFRAILTDPQIKVLEKACARMLEDESDWHVNPPTDEERRSLDRAWAAIQMAEVIVP